MNQTSQSQAVNQVTVKDFQRFVPAKGSNFAHAHQPRSKGKTPKAALCAVVVCRAQLHKDCGPHAKLNSSNASNGLKGWSDQADNKSP
jgi:hypothetical protein